VTIKSLVKCFVCTIETLKTYIKDVFRKSKESGLGSTSVTKKPEKSNLKEWKKAKLVKIKHAPNIEKAARLYGLDPHLVAAICVTESSLDERAMRFEPNYQWLFKADKFAREWRTDLKTEVALQRFSYGLMQIMGATARELGFDAFLPNLCKPEVGLFWGCKYFAILLNRHGDRDKAIVSYNAGSPRWDASKGEWENQVYLDKVLARYREFKSAYGNSESTNS